METTLLKQRLGLDKTWEDLGQASTEQDFDALESLSAELARRIKEGTVTVEEIETFLGRTPDIPPDLKSPLLEFLRLKKGWLLLGQDRVEEALRQSEEVLGVNAQAPKALTLEAVAMVSLERYEEASQAFHKAYLRKDELLGQNRLYLHAILKGWSGSSLLWCLQGILKQDLKISKAGVDDYLAVVDKARAEGLGSAVIVPIAEGDLDSIPEDLRDAVAELEVMVRLLSIKDPFDRWRELVKEVSKVWPEGVSAVDAIREDRDHEWST